MNRKPGSGAPGLSSGAPAERGSRGRGASGGGRSELRAPSIGRPLDCALTSATPTNNATKAVNTLQMFRISSTPVSIIYDAHCARHTILANYYIGFDQPLAAIKILRHCQRPLLLVAYGAGRA